MQINPLLRDLVEQYYGSMEALPPNLSQFLQTVNNLFASVSIDSGSRSTQKSAMDSVSALNETSEKYLALAQSFTARIGRADQAQEIYDTLTSLLLENFEFKSVRVFKANSAGTGLDLVSTASREFADAQIPAKSGSILAAAESRKTLFTSNDLPDNLDASDFTELSIPLIAQNELLGVLNILANERASLDSPTRMFLEMIASQASFALIGLKSHQATPAEAKPIKSEAPLAEGSWKTFREISTLKFQQYGYDPNLRTAVHLDDSVDIPVERLPNKPLEVQGEVIGSFGIQTGENELLTADERELLESISEEVSQALERAQLLESSQRSAAELAVLNEMGNLFSEALDEETIIDGLYTYTSKLIQVPQFYVAFYDDKEDTISFPKVILNGEIVTPEHPAADNFKTRPSGTGLTGYIIKNRRPILIEEDAEKVLEEIGLPNQSFAAQTHSWLGVPMTMGDQVLGVITIQSDSAPGLYNQHHLELLSTIANQAAVALNNIRLFQLEQERAEQERLVRTITDKVRRGTNTKAILEIAIEELSQVLNAEISAIQLGTPEQLIETAEPVGPQQSPPQSNGSQTKEVA